MTANNPLKMLLGLALTVSLGGCGPGEPPLDANGQTPQQVLMQTYLDIVEGNYDGAQRNFSPAFIEEFVAGKNKTFAEYTSNAAGWKAEWLKTKLVGNDYNEAMWRAKVIPDEGKGAGNGPGIVHDFYQIDGV